MRFLLEYLAQPWSFLGAIVALTIATMWWRRRESRGRLLVVTIALGLLVLISLPASAYVALGTLEWAYPADVTLAAPPEVVVILAGNIYGPSADRPDAELGNETFYRCRHALRLGQTNPDCLMLVSGGYSPDAPHGPRLADAMHDFLIEQGIKPGKIIVENTSATTYENAVNSCRLLRERGIQRMVLVTDAKHMKRASLSFRKQGIEVIPSPCNYFTTRFQNHWQEYLPSPVGASRFQEALHEWGGIGYYWLRGWL